MSRSSYYTPRAIQLTIYIYYLFAIVGIYGCYKSADIYSRISSPTEDGGAGSSRGDDSGIPNDNNGNVVSEDDKIDAPIDCGLLVDESPWVYVDRSGCPDITPKPSSGYRVTHLEANGAYVLRAYAINACGMIVVKAGNWKTTPLFFKAIARGILERSAKTTHVVGINAFGEILGKTMSLHDRLDYAVLWSKKCFGLCCS